MNKRYSSLLWVKPVTSRPKKWGIAFPPFDEKSLRIDVFYINVILFFWKYNLLPFPCFLLVHAEPCSICHPQCDELVLVPSTGGALFILLHIFCQTPVEGVIVASPQDDDVQRWWSPALSASFLISMMLFPLLSPSSWLWYCSPLSASFLKALCPQFPTNKITNNKTKQRWHDIQKHQSSNLKRWHLQNNISELLNLNNINHPPILTILARYPTITNNAKYHKETNVSFANCL